MLVYIFYSNVFVMGTLIFGFHQIFKRYDVEKKPYEKFSINMMRSLICGTIAHEAYKKYSNIWIDKCLDNQLILNDFKEYHNMFLSYFIYDTILLWYQVYLKIEKNVRYDLLFHHLLAITALIIIDYYGIYGISLMIGLSEGMSLVTGPKLLSMYYGKKYLTNFFIIYRLLYLIFIRMLFIWPSLIYFYNYVTLYCDKYKEDRNILLVVFLVITIIHAEINWLNSGRKELTRI